MSEHQIAGRPAFESVWKRAWNDAWAFLRTPYHVVGNSLLTLLVTLLALNVTDDLTKQIVAPAIAFVFILGAVIVVTSCRAPLAQRSEVRREAVRLSEKLRPKLTVGGTVVHQIPPDDCQPGAMPLAPRICLKNDSNVIAEKCIASLLDVKPFVETLPLVDGNRTAYGGNVLDGLPDIPFPIALRWSANEAPEVDIPAHGEALLDVCYYYYQVEWIALAFHSEDKRPQYSLPVADLLFSIRIDSRNCLPIYCVCKYMPDCPVMQVEGPCAIKYIGRDRPNLKDYQEFNETPRPSHWD